jgi:hypothetical protein
MARIADQVHKHLLELAGVAIHKWQNWVKIQLQPDIFGCGTEALKFESARDNLVERHATTLRTGFPGGEQQLAEDSGGALRFLKNLTGFVRAADWVATQEQALRVTQDAGERVAKFVSDTGDHLAESGEFFCLQQPGLENALGG